MKLFLRKLSALIVLTLFCSTAYGSNTIQNKVCVDSGYKNIQGKYGTYRIYRDCWRWKVTYKVVDGPYYEESQNCSLHRDNGCGQVGDECDIWNAQYSFCESSTVTFQCSKTFASRHTDLCGNLLICPDGHCADEYKTQKDATEDFKQAASSLALANEIAKEFDYNKLSLFKGEEKQCSKSVLSFADCCKGGGWSDDIGLLDCSTEEKELRIKREQKAAHYVGTYCSREVLKNCVSRKYTYCTYPSKLARIIIEQGNSQLGRGYGSAERPDCSGFSIEQLSSLDFNAMSLREFYPDVVQKTARGTVADPNQLVKDIADKLNNTGGD